MIPGEIPRRLSAGLNDLVEIHFACTPLNSTPFHKSTCSQNFIHTDTVPSLAEGLQMTDYVDFHAQTVSSLVEGSRMKTDDIF